jgi:hypothetical protein
VINYSVKLVACIGIFGAAVLANNNAQAMTNEECDQLSGNMYLAAIERGECDVSIQTAAGPEILPIEEKKPPRRTRDSRGEGGKGGEGGKKGGERAGPVGRAGPNP